MAPDTRPVSPAESTAFDRLAPFIQEYIWKHGWSELRDIQVRASAAAFDTDAHILLAAGTASGKTEAAFLPILTEIDRDPPTSVAALYIGPLKALINDQFLRLGELCAEVEIPVTAWHGDVAAGRKKALLQRPRGILQITPEALEGLLLNRSPDLTRLFGDLRWVVVDEVHAFMVSDRGGQVLALLDRLARFAIDPSRLPRRVGLSATLGDYREAAAWLAGATARPVEVIAESAGRTVYLLVDHFLVKPEHPAAARSANREALAANEADSSQDQDTASADQIVARQADLYRAAYEATQRRKSLIFTNSRSDAEEIITALRRIAERKHTPDIYYVHHGSIAASLREDAEKAMREGDEPACTAATVTLELGIDLGHLDRVLQLGPTFSVASFLQRLGRAGRRGQQPEMFFLLREEGTSNTGLLECIPWELLQAIAIIQLYAEEKWIEPIARKRFPGSLLYHQTMSIMGAAGELTPPQLAERVLTLAPFAAVSPDDFRTLLRHLVAIDHLERTPEGGLILGLAGERVVRNFRFLATFQDTTEWAVKEGTRDIGTIASPVPQGERFALAGRTWEVVEIVSEQRVLVVHRVKGALRTHFLGGQGAEIHDRIVERMRRVLDEDTTYPYLSERATARLNEARHLAHACGIARGPQIVPLSRKKSALVPWAGSRVLRTFGLLLTHAGVRNVSRDGFYLTVDTDSGLGASADHLTAAADAMVTAEDLANPLDRAFCIQAKYDEFLPDDLLKKSFAADCLDAEAAAAALRAMLRGSEAR